jgi:hypothetical protein
MGITTGITMGLYETKRFGHHHNHGIIMDIVSCITMGFLKKKTLKHHQDLWLSNFFSRTAPPQPALDVRSYVSDVPGIGTRIGLGIRDWDLHINYLYYFNGHFKKRLIGGTYYIFLAYFLGLCKGISPQNMARNMVQYLQFRILKLPLTTCLTLLGYMGVSSRYPHIIISHPKLDHFGILGHLHIFEGFKQ